MQNDNSKDVVFRLTSMYPNYEKLYAFFGIFRLCVRVIQNTLYPNDIMAHLVSQKIKNITKNGSRPQNSTQWSRATSQTSNMR